MTCRFHGDYGIKMAALNLEAAQPLEKAMPGVVSTKRLEGMLVSPKVIKPVPNHLADTKIFSKTQRNGILQTKPSVIHFDGYEVGKTHQQTLQIINASRDNQQMHIIPPTTPFFSIKYSKKNSSLVPGLSLDVIVDFRPKEWRYYYDCIRVHSKGEQNLLIPIHAYPVINTTKFPRHIKFPTTPIGQTRTKAVSLECGVPVEFEYQLTHLQSHPAFTVEPMNGVVPANGKVDILITFTPAEYSTAVMELKLELSQFNSNPLLCTITGSSAPGLAADRLRLETAKMTQQLKQQTLTLNKSATPHHLPPLTKTAKHSQKTSRKKSSQPISSVPSKAEDNWMYRIISAGNAIHPVLQKGVNVILQDGYRFPANLDTPGAIGKVLAQQPGKAKASELRQAASLTAGAGVATQQMKEAIFLQEVRQTAAEERANRLRWVTKLGGVSISDEEKESILKAREEANAQYQRHCHVAIPSEEYGRRGTGCVRRRTRRRAQEHSTATPTFDLYTNDAWRRRYVSLQRFVQAARKVVVQVRTQERLTKLQRLTAGLKAGKSMEESLADITGQDNEKVDLVASLPIDTSRVRPFTFPKFEPEQKFDEEGNLMIGDLVLKKFDVKPTDIDYHLQQCEEYPTFKLKVPLEYEEMGYHAFPLPELDSYVPPGLPKKLRTGALEELENLGDIPGVDPCFLTPDALTSLPVGAIIGAKPRKAETLADSLLKGSFTDGGATDLKETDKGGEIQREVSQLSVQDVEEGAGDVRRAMAVLKPPPDMMKSPQLHPLHIFYPAPGVMSHVPMLPHSEVSLDHALLPLPTYPMSKHPQVRLHPLSVIPGLMQWKQFPSHCLLAMNGEKKVASVWKPRRSDPFSTELLPTMDKPELLTGPQCDDFVDIENSEVQPVPTMEMIRSQFSLLTTAPTVQIDDHTVTGHVHTHVEEGSRTEQKESVATLSCPDGGPDLRQIAEKSLAKEKAGQRNQLGEKIEERWRTYQELLGSQVRGSLGSADYDS